MSVQVVEVAKDPLAAALGEECVRRWLFGLRPVSRATYRSVFKHWLLWLWKQPGWMGRKPGELLDWQELAKHRERRVLLSFMKDFVQEKGGTYRSMQVKLSHLRSFFMANDVEIPEALNWNPEPTREPVQGLLTFDQLRDIVQHAKPRDQAVFLTLLQGIMDKERFLQFNMKYAQRLVERLKSKDFDSPFRIDFLNGRKRNKNEFYTYIYHDALKAWERYFDKIRGWPKAGEPLACDYTLTNPLSKDAITDAFDTIARQLKYKPPTSANKGDRGHRTGVAVHDAFRDVVVSRLQTAKKEGFDTTCTEFWMGHKVDPYNYNRFTKNEPEYVVDNAKIAARYLNVITGKTESTEIKKMSQENQELRNDLARVNQKFEQQEIAMKSKLEQQDVAIRNLSKLVETITTGTQTKP